MPLCYSGSDLEEIVDVQCANEAPTISGAGGPDNDLERCALTGRVHISMPSFFSGFRAEAIRRSEAIEQRRTAVLERLSSPWLRR